MAEMMVLSAVAEVTKRLVISLLEVRAAKQDNTQITREINEFVSDLDKNVARLKCKLPPNVSGGALDSLLRKLEEAQTFVQSRQDQNFFKSMWTAKQTTEKLKFLRRNLDSAFQLALFFTTLDVALEMNKKIDDFLFSRFPGTEALFHERRASYRREALKLAHEGQDADALLMLENVLEWDIEDAECQRLREVISRRINQKKAELELDLPWSSSQEQLMDRNLSAYKSGPATSSGSHLQDLRQFPKEEHYRTKSFEAISSDKYQPSLKQRANEERVEGMGVVQKLKDIVGLLSMETPTTTLIDVAMDFANLAQAPENQLNMAIYPGALEKLVGLLTLDVPDAVLFEAARAFANLSSAQENRDKMARVPRAIERLACLMCNEVPVRVIFEAARAFANLAQEKDHIVRMGAAPNVVKTLVELLRSDAGENVQIQAGLALVEPQAVLFEAARAFANLSSAQENRDKMARVPRAIERLACLMCSEVPVRIKSEAARAFANLAQEKDHIVRMGAAPNVVETLVELLCRDAGENVQIQAARALVNLACAVENVTKMAAYPKTIGRVVDLLSKDIPVAVQLEAALVLARMACVKAKAVPSLMEGRKWLVELAEYPGALPKLIDLLAKGTPETLQLHAARAIVDLTLDDKNLITVANTEGAIERLVSLLTSSIPISLQEQAALAFANLTYADRNKSMMVSFPGALEKLVTLLGKGVHSSLQYQAAIERLVGLLASDVEERVQSQAAGSLASLAVEKQNAVKLATYEEVISSLTNLLSWDVPEKVQSNAMMAFANLAFPNENKRRLAEFPGVLEKLVDLLSHGVPETVQEHAARAFAHLASARKTLMASYPGAKDKLMALLREPAASENVKACSRDALSRLSESSWVSLFT